MRSIRSGRETLTVTPRPVEAGFRGAVTQEPVPVQVSGCNVHPVYTAAEDAEGGGTLVAREYQVTSRSPWPGGPYSKITRANGDVLEQDGPAQEAVIGIRTRHWSVRAQVPSSEAV